MKKYYNTRQVLRDVENGTLTPEEGEKILAEMEEIASRITESVQGVEERLDRMGKGLEKKMDKLSRNLDSKFH